MKKRIAIFLFFAFATQVSSESPIHFKLEKGIGDTYFLKLEHAKNFGVQKDAPHKILLNPSAGLSIESADLKLKGKASIKKKEYFESVSPMPITLKGTGQLTIDAKIFYCDYDRNICIPGKIQQTENIR
ncbi:hypothetical protein CH373_14020 [Leptospira perolatii]|uniref:Thiol:disulfide interchange protein DsbD N-terminal domain-containing protein n=1 Tax=Leptospira perolatii TaxID=2023191 RepID=A0A2M9ZKC5_9LEPT|nr:hypothetical protein [Leptospira perolatii]PJZ69385.1 hypothetical protein CH360_11585 [Leptospira perolatii]PJZ72520.1 hypothetical protein CH373_14020 [Leptospira perolatii]